VRSRALNISGVERPTGGLTRRRGVSRDTGGATSSTISPLFSNEIKIKIVSSVNYH
jgi:hypothetical protein